MRTNKYWVGLLAFFMLVTMACACGLTDKIISQATGGDQNFQSTSTLWSDVPQMDGTELSPMEDMPPFVKLAMRFALGNLGKLNNAGEDQTTGNVDWIAFVTDKTPEDVQAFYTNDLMTSNGWDPNDTPCISGSAGGSTSTDAGMVCIFQKTQAGTGSQLVIITGEDPQTKKTNVFFLRLEELSTPVPGATP